MADVQRRTIRARMNLTRNEQPMYSQDYFDEDREIDAHTHQRIVLGTSSGQQQFDLTSVVNGAAMMLTTDRDIVIAVDQDTNTMTINGPGMIILTGSFTHVYVENNSTTYQAEVEFIATD